MSRKVLGPVIGTRIKAPKGGTLVPNPVTGRVDQGLDFEHVTVDDKAVFTLHPIDPEIPTEPIASIDVYAVPSPDGKTSGVPEGADVAFFEGSGAPCGTWTAPPATPPVAPDPAVSAQVSPAIDPLEVAVQVLAVPINRSDWQTILTYAE
jgi:hypothetical protein